MISPLRMFRRLMDIAWTRPSSTLPAWLVLTSLLSLLLFVVIKCDPVGVYTPSLYPLRAESSSRRVLGVAWNAEHQTTLTLVFPLLW